MVVDFCRGLVGMKVSVYSVLNTVSELNNNIIRPK